MAAPSVAARGLQQKNSEWENLLGAAHLELRAQQTGLVLEADTADAANARGTSSETSYGAGDDRHESAAAASSTRLGSAKRNTGGGAGRIVSSRGAADRDDAASLPTDRPKAFVGQGSTVVPAAYVNTSSKLLPGISMANDSTASPSPVVPPPLDSSRRMAARPPWMTGSRPVTVSTSKSPPPALTAFGMVAAAAAASTHLVEDRNRDVRVQAKNAGEAPVRVAARPKGMGRRGPLGQSHFKGVSITRAGTWRAVIYKGRKQQYLGVFDSEFDAARAYDAAALRLFPEGAPLNNPDAVERQLNEISAADGKPIATAGTPSFPHEQESPQS